MDRIERKIKLKSRQALDSLKPYSAGKPIWEVQQEFGLDRVIKLASNENSLGPSPKAVQAVQEKLMELHRYPDERSSRLVDALSREYQLSPEHFVVTNGGDELVLLLSRAYIEPEDEIIIPVPTFSEYEFGAKLMSGSIVRVPLRKHFEYAVEDLLDAVTEKTKVVYLCTPNNPTGTYLPEREMRRLLDGLPERVLVMIDAAYSHYATAEDYCDGTIFVREGYPVIALHTFSKIYGLAGIRVGYGAAPQEIIRTLLQVKEPFNVNVLAEAAAAAALGDTDHIEASRLMNEEGRRQLYQGFDELKLAYTKSLSNFILVELGNEAERLYQKLLENGIIVRYAKSWGYPEHVRISVGTFEENESLLRKLKEII